MAQARADAAARRPDPADRLPAPGRPDRRRPRRGGGLVLGRRPPRRGVAAVRVGPAGRRLRHGRRRRRRRRRHRSASSRSRACWSRTSPTGGGCTPRSARRPASASPSTSATAAAWSRGRCRECVAEVAEHLVNVQIDDMRRGVHEHLEFGTGEIDFPPVLARPGRGRLPRAGRRRAAPALARRAGRGRPLAWSSCAPPPGTPASDPSAPPAPVETGRTTGGGLTTADRYTPGEGRRMTPDSTRAALRAYPIPTGWTRRCAGSRQSPPRSAGCSRAVGRRCGRAALPDAPGWTADDAARVLLLPRCPATHADVRREPLPARRRGRAAGRAAGPAAAADRRRRGAAAARRAADQRHPAGRRGARPVRPAPRRRPPGGRRC